MEIIILLLLLNYGCADNGRKDNSAAENKNTLVSNDSKSINEQPVKTVIDFIIWYRNNLDRIHDIKLVNYTEVYDSTKFYSVNFQGTEEYLRIIKSSGFVSDEYVEYWRQYFKKSDEHFKSNPQNDGPPDGFDYDFIMNGQDYDQELKEVEKSTVETITGIGNSKVVKLKISKYMTLTY